MDKQINTPVLFFIYNRSENVKQVFDEIRKVRPLTLIVYSDGARNDFDQIFVDRSRSLINVDWDCNLIFKKHPHNLGCKKNISLGLDYAFSRFDELIILEDDCVPDTSFFYFCEEMLERYRNVDRIAHISGSNFYNQNFHTNDSYFFSYYPHIWGWASWKRSWKNYDIDMQTFPDRFLDRMTLINKLIWKYMYFSETKNNNISTWDIQWIYSCWKHNKMCITPAINLIRNIGYDENKKSPEHDIPTLSMDFPLHHPVNIEFNQQAEKVFRTRYYTSNTLKELSGFYLRKLIRRIL